MTQNTRSIDDIQKVLEDEFCPPLDSSLVAAICNEMHSTSDFSSIREIIRNLAIEATVDLATIDGKDPINDTSGGGELASLESSLPSATFSSEISPTIASPLLFLRAAFPDMSIQLIQDAIENGSKGETIDMEALVEELLSSELAMSLQNAGGSKSEAPQSSWEIVAKKKTSQKAKRKEEKVILGDIRQRQQIMTAKGKQVDVGETHPWSQLVSLADYLSMLLPPTSANVFLSAFHSPEYPSPFHALSAHLNSQTNKRPEEAVDVDLIAMKELITGDLENDGDFDAVWARKCIQATGGRLGDAMDLFKLLKDLENPQGPITHLPAPLITSGKRITPSATPTTSLNSPIRSNSVPKVKSSPPQDSNTWQVVEKRQPKAQLLPPHAEFIPAYRQFKAVPTWIVDRDYAKQDDVRKHRDVEQEWRDKRVEALKEASRHWQKSHDGYSRQIAAYYSNKANEYLGQSRAAAMEAARALIVKNRNHNKASGAWSGDGIDLHGMTREEALIIVKEALAERATSKDPSKPLQIITGRGNHSAGQISILTPAVRKALKTGGWKFRELEGSIIVYERV